MKKQALLLSGLILTMFIDGCENSARNYGDLSEVITIAREEVFEISASEVTDQDINAASFGGHLFSGSMMVSGPHLFFGRNFPDCVTVSVSGDEFPKEITIDYGDGCTGAFEIERTGTITLHMTDTILNPGAVYTITFEDVSIGMRQVDKMATITNEGLNEEGNWVISSQSESTIIFEKEEGTITISRVFSEVKEWLAGFETPEMEDDRFLKSGGGSMLVNGDLKFERSTTDPLLFDRTCRYPLSGIIRITKEGEYMVIDFGEGECDNIALVRKDGESEKIDLDHGICRNGS